MTKMLNNSTYSPSLIQSVSNACMGDSEFFSPTANAQGCTFVCKHGRAFTIVHLLLWSCPPTICCPAFLDTLVAMSTRVVAVAILTINRVCAAGLFAHIFKKVDKRTSPPTAHCNSASAVNLIAILAAAIASIVHLTPRSVFRGLLALASMTACFKAIVKFGRIIRRHDSTPDKLDCDRAESVHNNCFGSFHFSVT